MYEVLFVELPVRGNTEPPRRALVQVAAIVSVEEQADDSVHVRTTGGWLYLHPDMTYDLALAAMGQAAAEAEGHQQ